MNLISSTQNQTDAQGINNQPEVDPFKTIGSLAWKIIKDVRKRQSEQEKAA